MSQKIPVIKKYKEETLVKIRLKKMVLGAMFTALTVALSGFSIPIGASKCFPIQHLMNILAGILLGPYYGVMIAFCTSLIRNLLGTGTLFAFPGSMVGAFLGAWLYRWSGKIYQAYIGEIIGTGLIGATLCFPIATWIMGKEVTVFFYVIPFMLSTCVGTVLAAVLLEIMKRTGILRYLRRIINE